MTVDLPGRGRDDAEALSGSRRVATGYFLIEAHKHALHLADPEIFAGLAEADRLFDAAALDTPPGWVVEMRGLWQGAAKGIQDLFSGLIYA